MSVQYIIFMLQGSLVARNKSRLCLNEGNLLEEFRYSLFGRKPGEPGFEINRADTT